MNCPHCSSDRAVKNGKTAAGSQRYKCKNCDRVFSLSDNKGGRPCTEDQPLTAYQRLRRHLDSKKED